MMRFCIFVLLLLLSSSFPINAQSHEGHSGEEGLCGTPEISYEEWMKGLGYKRLDLPKNNGMTQLPLRAHIVTQSNESGGLTLTELNEAMANLNNVYHEANIEWYLASVNYIANSSYYDLTDSEEDALCAPNVIDDAVNVFFVNSINGGGICGYAYYPGNSDVTLRIVMRNSCTSSYINGTFVHEFGHHLSLPHTHNGTSNGPTHPYAEHVPRSGAQSNCNTAGDYICDTEADPTGSTSSCNYTGGGSDIYGNPYTPNVDNIMSYYPDWCGGIFTPGQYTQIGAGLNARLNHSAYDIDGAGPESVADPSNLSGSSSATSVNLTWSDNASNEAGYLIERSDDGGNTFKTLPFGGVADNVTSFTDDNIQSNTNYKYRVKASNDNPDHYSNILSITTNVIVCTDAPLLFNGAGDLVQTPISFSGVPTTLPNCQSELNVELNIVGDIGSSFEICDILGEDGSTILGQTGTSFGDCNSSGATTSFVIAETDYNSWAVDGTLTLFIDSNTQVDNICPVSEVSACTSIQNCGSNPPNNCPDDYEGSNMLTGNQDVNEDFETDGIIESNQIITGNANVTYDSGTSVELLPGFNSMLGTAFQVILDGCGNLAKGDAEPVDN